MVVAAIALVCAAASVSPATRPIRGLSLDILTALRWEVFGRRQDPAASPTVVVAIDEESLRTAAVQGLADADLDRRDRPRAGRDARRRRQGGRLRHRDSDIDRAVGDSVRRRHARRESPRLRPRLPARARRCGGERQGRAGRGSGRQPADPALAGTAHRRTPAAEHPPAQRPYRQRRCRAAPAADLRRQRREGALDGGRTGVAGARRRARVR